MSPLASARIIRVFVSAMLFLGFGVGVLSYRLMTDGKQFYEEAEQANKAGVPWRNAVSRYEDAAKTYFPGNPYPGYAFWKLSQMAKSAQMRGEVEKETYLWEVVRRSAVSQRHVFQPFEPYVTQSTIRLSHLRAPVAGANILIDSSDTLDDPNVFASILLFLGLLVWIVGASVGIFSQGKKLLIGLTVSASGFVLWAAAAWLA